MSTYTYNPGKNILVGRLHRDIGRDETVASVVTEVRYEAETDTLTVTTSTELSAAEETQLGVLVSGHVDEKEEMSLVIKPFLSGQKGDTKDVDFTLIGLFKGSPVYDKGEKKEHTYYADIDETIPAVKRTFVDWYADEDDGQGGTVSVWQGVDRTFEWFDDQGAVSLTKTEKQSYDHRMKGAQKKKRRQRQIDNLEGGAEGTPIEPMVTAIFEHYKEDVDKYINSPNYTGLADAINNETDPTISGYLAIVVGAPGNPTATVKDAILYEIT